MIPPLGKCLQLILSTFLLLMPFTGSASEKPPSTKEANDFQTISAEMRSRKLPLLLAFRAEYCGFCRQLENEYLIPMQQDQRYTERILIRSFTLGATETLTDFDGKKLDAETFTNRYSASLTPTLVFLDADGKEVAERLLGYNNPDFYGSYLESAIDAAYKAVNGKM